MLSHVRKGMIVICVGLMGLAFLITFAMAAGEPLRGQSAQEIRNEDRAARRWMTLAGGLFIVGAGGCAVASVGEYRASRRAAAEEPHWEPPRREPPAPTS